MSSSPEQSPANGLGSPIAASVIEAHINGDQSDSDLSEVQAADVEEPSPGSAHQHDSSDDANLEDEFRAASESSDNDESDDADFDIVESVASPRSNHERDERESSKESQRASKRKAPVALEDDYMRNDPELYGLRRSVWIIRSPIRDRLSSC